MTVVYPDSLMEPRITDYLPLHPTLSHQFPIDFHITWIVHDSKLIDLYPGNVTWIVL